MGDIEPANNVAEQAIRIAAIHQRMPQGTRGATGQRWCERLWTVVATCAQQGRSVFDFLWSPVEAPFRGALASSLLADTT